MKRIIEISEDVYEWIKEHPQGTTSYPVARLYSIIKNSTPIKECMKDPCTDCSENTWCGRTVCKEAQDYISRKKALEEIIELGVTGFYEANEHSKEAYYDIKHCIENLPSVYPKSDKPSGKWIERFNEDKGEVEFICSKCNHTQPFGTDYCWKCGSRNVVEEQTGENT